MIFATTSNSSHVTTVALAIESAILIAGILGIAWANFRNKDKSQTDTNLKEALAGSQALVSVLKEQNEKYVQDLKDLQDKHFANQKEIGELRGELKTLKEIPLKEIAAQMKSLNKSITDMPDHLRTMIADVANQSSAKNMEAYKNIVEAIVKPVLEREK